MIVEVEHEGILKKVMLTSVRHVKGLVLLYFENWHRISITKAEQG